MTKAMTEAEYASLQRTIVSEVSKTWLDGKHTSEDTRTVGQKFERLIEVNRGRGYKLRDWKFSSIAIRTDSGIEENETIIAVFDRI